MPLEALDSWWADLRAGRNGEPCASGAASNGSGTPLDHHTGTVLGYVFGRRKDAVFLRLQQLLEPFASQSFTRTGEALRAASRCRAAISQKEHTQKIESKHINLRTRIKRLVRRTLCFSKTERMHDLVLGLFTIATNSDDPFDLMYL